ncbi:hypothetical protein H920_18571 [Fukomys damarensis]|uniref:Uncharacterized protein n=1 Tax=Fukomys damarensis TaxID=885580 RepID=A0A091CM87_FUKDA|nr:hypothetical protein H920_18571 [Fukomys damarensis]
MANAQRGVQTVDAEEPSKDQHAQALRPVSSERVLKQLLLVLDTKEEDVVLCFKITAIPADLETEWQG